LGPIRKPPFAAHVVHVTDVVGHEVEERAELVFAADLAFGELLGERPHLVVGLREALDGAAIPRAKVFPVLERRPDDDRDDLAQRRR
jgi:hypothetical protein